MAAIVVAFAAIAAVQAAHAEGTFFKAKRAAKVGEATAEPAAAAASAAPAAAPAPEPVAQAAPPPSPSPPPPPPASPPVPVATASPAPAPEPQPPQVAAADSIAGPVGRVLSTDSFYVSGRRIQLAGVEGVGEPHIAALSQWLHSGRTVDCLPAGARYTCITSDRMDVARVVLRSGVARASPDASLQYRQDEERARRDGRGIWHSRQ